MMDRTVEIEAAEALLDVGVSLPLLSLRIRKKRVSILRVTMKRPFLGTLVRMSKIYTGLGVTYDEMADFNQRQEAAFMAEHGKDMARLVSLAICRGSLSGYLFSGLLSRIILWHCDDRYIFGAGLMFRGLLGTKSFMNIIRSVERANPMKPRLSQTGRES